MKNFLKKYKWWIIFGVLAVLVDTLTRYLFFTIIFSYVLFIKFLLSNFLKEKSRKIIKIIILIILISSSGLTIYVNYYLPHGQMIDTGETEEVCIGDRNCKEVERYVEDTRNLNIPDWAKFLRRYGNMMFFALFFAFIVSMKKEENNI